MLVVTPDNFDLYADFFSKFNPVQYDFNGSLSSSRIIEKLSGQDFVLFVGDHDWASEFGARYSYEHSANIENHARNIFDYALGAGVPILGINWGIELVALKCGMDFKIRKEKDPHLLLYKDSVYSVDTPYDYGVIPLRTSRYKYDIVDNGFAETIYLSSCKSLSVRWNPVTNSTLSGAKLYDELFLYYYKKSRK